MLLIFFFLLIKFLKKRNISIDSLKNNLSVDLIVSRMVGLRVCLGGKLKNISTGSLKKNTLSVSLTNSCIVDLRISLGDKLRNILRNFSIDSLKNSLKDSLKNILRDSLGNSLKKIFMFIIFWCCTIFVFL